MSYRRYCLTLLYPLIISIALIFVLEILAREIPNAYKSKNHAITTNRDNYRTLVLGSSHTYFGVNPDYMLMSTFNAANVSQSLNYDYFVLENASKHLIDLEYVVLPLSIFSLYSDLDSGVESWRKYNYRHWFNYNKYANTELFDIKTYSVFLASPDRIGLLKRLFQHYYSGSFDKTWSRRGWGTNYSHASSESALLESGKRAALRHQTQADINYRSLDSLNQIAEIFNGRNIKLLIVTPPAYATYREHLNRDRVRNMVSIAMGLANSNKNIRYINYLLNPQVQ